MCMSFLQVRQLVFLSCCLLLLTPLSIQAQFDPNRITIARDAWGVPHIHAPTDAEVAYGLAWATGEDDFKTMQEQLLATRGQLAAVNGKDAAAIDIAVQFMGLDEIVAEKINTDVSPAFKKILDGYVAGANAYAAAHPKEVLLKNLFPLTPADILKGYALGLAVMTGTDGHLSKILNGKITAYEGQLPKGSNAFAFNANKTSDGQTYLAINSHQPLQGLYSWYEAHLVSDEGTNILGATFPGGITIFHGVNEHLGWAHTINAPDFGDVYRLTMHPSRKDMYRFDGEWFELEKYKAKTKVKIGPLKLPVSRAYYKSKYGLTLKTDQGVYALRFVANQDIRSAEQWYRMNKAQSFADFKAALRMQGIANTNIVYADDQGNIFYISNARLPIRNPAYDWSQVLPGDTSATLWTETYPLDSVPQVLNPDCGYVFNTNHSPYNATAIGQNPALPPRQWTMGFRTYENNRSLRLRELIERSGKISYERFKEIKYDLSFTDTLYDPFAVNLHDIKGFDPSTYPDLSETITLLNAWDHRCDTSSMGASIFILAVRDLFRKIAKEDRRKAGNRVSQQELLASLRHAQSHLMETFGTVKVPLGQLQRHRRGEVDLPLPGGPNVLAAMYSDKAEDGRVVGQAGDSYIELVRFTDEGPVIETVNAYGASAKPDSPHFTDQMPLFTTHRTKKMTLDWEQVKQNAKRMYHPK